MYSMPTCEHHVSPSGRNNEALPAPTLFPDFSRVVRIARTFTDDLSIGHLRRL